MTVQELRKDLLETREKVLSFVLGWDEIDCRDPAFVAMEKLVGRIDAAIGHLDLMEMRNAEKVA